MTGEQKGVQACIDIVKRRKQYYELYREPGAMQTKPATFATLDDILIHLEAHLERLQKPVEQPRVPSPCNCTNGCKAWDCPNL